MADRVGKCTNYGGCTLAYRNEQIAAAGDFVCPECSQPLQEAIAKPAPARNPLLLIGASVAAVALIAAGIFLANSGSEAPDPAPEETKTEEPVPVPAPVPVVSSPPSPEPTTPPLAVPEPQPKPATTEAPPTPIPPDPEPPAKVSAEQRVDVNLASDENQRVRQEVLHRIDAMPNLTEANKVKLHDRVNRARGMGKIITIPFVTGATALAPQAVEQLSEVVRAPQIAALLDDPTAVFVILGFADKRGDAKANLKVSLTRAESVLQTLRDKCALQNVMQAVGMGGSEMFDAGDHAKNRIVEVWVVLP